MTEIASFVRDAVEDEDEDTREMAKLDALLDNVKLTPPGVARRALVLELASVVTADARAADVAERHGGRELLLKSLDGAVRNGDEELMNAVGAAVAKRSRCDSTDAVELMAVGGSQVGAASQRPPGVEKVRLCMKKVDINVHESSWNDAGLAWRIWGAARILAHALDAAADTESRGREAPTTISQVSESKCEDANTTERDTFEEVNVTLPSTSAQNESTPFIRIRGSRVLELGAGCGLGGLAAAAVGATEVTITEGAPGSLRALQNSAATNISNRVTARVAFLDWRDDQAVLDSMTNSETIPRVDSGTSVLEIQSTSAGTSVSAEKTKTTETNQNTSMPKANWVHKLDVSTAGVELATLPILSTTETFDLIIGSDLLYDESHAAPLAASLALRLKKERKSKAHVVLAVRNGYLISSLIVKAHGRGLRATVQCLDSFQETDVDFGTQQGGHITRAESDPIAAEDWRFQGGAIFAAGKGFVAELSDERFQWLDSDESCHASADVEQDLENVLVGLQGRVAMVSFRWPERTCVGRE